MTYAKQPVAPEAIAPEEQAYSPFFTDQGLSNYRVMGAGHAAYTQRQAPMPMPEYSYAPASHASHDPYAPPPGYKLVPLGGDDGDRKGMTRGQKIAAVVVVLAIVAAIIFVVKNRKKEPEKAPLTPTKAISKLPTSRIAQSLYKRLERNGSASKSVLAALDKIAQE